MRRVIRLDLAYDGTEFSGFGLQPNRRTVQGVLEAALASLLGHAVRATPAGRTDAGVHALGQVVSFPTEARLPAEAVGRALDQLLPTDILAGASVEADGSFDARRSARRRHYRYSVWNAERPHLWKRRHALHERRPLDLEAMQRAAQTLVGCHDFSSFIGHLSHEPRDVNPVRTLWRAEWSRRGRLLHFDCSADAFARHMVRNLVGTLLLVGQGQLAPSEVEPIRQARDRRAAGPTAPSHGLTLMKVDYQESTLDFQEGRA